MGRIGSWRAVAIVLLLAAGLPAQAVEVPTPPAVGPATGELAAPTPVPPQATVPEPVPADIPGAPPEVDAEVDAKVGEGLASWYGPGFHGRRTASGERFDMNALTAAHPTLPFGTLVQVRSLVNGRTVDVRINDRGPHIRQRVIDLSRAAAQALGLLQSGTGTKPVELRVKRRRTAR